jgi:Fe-S-cluster containining protein
MDTTRHCADKEMTMKDKNVKSKLEILTPQALENSDKPQKMRLNKRTSCIRCGKCCSESSPSLMKADMSLFVSGVLSPENVYTIREGEPVRSGSDVYESFVEIIKIRENEEAAGCIFYSEGLGCIIYEDRPLQCKEYKCWETETPLYGLEESALKREDFFGSVGIVMDAIKKHNDKCSYKRLSSAIGRLNENKDDALDDIIDMLQYDTYIRLFLKDKLSVPSTAMDLILGRPLTETINEFGFRVENDGDEYILLQLKPEIKGTEIKGEEKK